MHFYQTKSGPLGFMVIAVFSWLTNTVINMYLSNYMSPSIYGNLYVAINFLSVVGSLACMGIQDLIPNLVPTLSTDSPYDHSRFILWSSKMIALVYLVSFAALGLIFLTIYYGWATIFNQSWHIAYYMFLVAPIYTAYNIITGLLSVTGKGDIAELVSSVAGPFSMAVAFSIFHLFKIPEPTEIIFLIAISNLVVLVISLLLFYAYQGSIISHVLKSRGRAHVDEPEWRKKSFIFFKASILSTIIDNSPLYLLEWLGSSEIDVAIYGIASTIQGLLATIQIIMFYNLLENKASDLYRHNKPELQRQLNQTNLIVFGVCIVMSLIVILMSDTVLSLFGKVYTGYGFALACFMLIKILDLTNDSSYVLLEIVDNGPSFLTKSLQYSLFYVVGCFPFIYYMGIYGFIIMRICFEILFSSALLIKAKRLTGLKTLIFF